MDAQNQEKGIVIQPKLALFFFGGIEIILILFSFIGQYLRLSPNSYSIHSLIQEKLIRDFIAEFNVNSEANLVTYYSVTMAIVASLLLFVIAYFKHAAKDRYRFYWTALAWFLLYISMDDASVIHEKISKYLKNWTVMGGWFEYKWVIVGLVVVGVFAIAFFRFWLHLDNKYKLLFLASASLFFGGAVGAELVGGRWAYSNIDPLDLFIVTLHKYLCSTVFCFNRTCRESKRGYALECQVKFCNFYFSKFCSSMRCGKHFVRRRIHYEYAKYGK
ncbi:MAG: hypothetical protein NTW69_19950 [Chloroflexi bacterium]|nr:hypothetical protein [Chloroflexota bacterium]